MKENKQKNVSRIRKITFYLQFCMGTPEGYQKSIFNTPKLKTRIHMEFIRKSLQAQPNNIKKLSKHQINQSKYKKSQIKVCLVLQKWKEGKNSTRRSFQPQPKILKIYQNTKSTNQDENFSKKYIKYLKSVKEPKIHMGATRRNLQAQPKMLKKMSEHQINQSEQKFHKKTFNVQRSQKFNPKKIIRTPNIPIKTKIFLKKTMFRT
jgi:hypothetical protein